MCRKSFLGNFVHTFCPDLYFHPLTSWAHHCSVKGFVSIPFRGRYPIAETIWIRAVQICHNGIYFPAFCFFPLCRCVNDNSDSKQVVDLFKWNRFFTHFIPDGINGFWTSEYLCLDALFFEYFFYRLDEVGYKFFPFCFLFVQFSSDEFVSIWICVLHGKVFQLGFYGVKTQPVCERSIEITRL